MKFKNRLSTGLILSFTFVTIIAFQNCGKKMSNEAASSSTEGSSNIVDTSMNNQGHDVVTASVDDQVVDYVTIASKTNKAAPLTSVPDPENPGFGKVTSVCVLCVNFVDLLAGQDVRTLDAYKIAYFNQNKSGQDFITKTLAEISKAPTSDYYHGIVTKEILLHAIAEFSYLKDYSKAQEQALVDLFNRSI